MSGIDELTEYIMQLILAAEKIMPMDATLYSAWEGAKTEYRQTRGELSDEQMRDRASGVMAAYVTYKVNTRSINDAKDMVYLLRDIKELKTKKRVTAKDIAALAEAAEKLQVGYLHTIEIVRKALTLVDYEHVASMALKVGKERAQQAATVQ